MTQQLKQWALYALWFSVGFYASQVVEWFFDKEMLVPAVGLLASVSIANNILRK